MLTDGAALRDVIVADLGGVRVGRSAARCGCEGCEVGLHLAQGPGQIDGGGTGCAQQSNRLGERCIGRIAVHGERHAVSGSGSDQRRTAHGHRTNGIGRIGDARESHHAELKRQTCLIDDLHVSRVFREPDRPIRFAVNLHSFLFAVF